MKTKTSIILSLIQCHETKDDEAFRNQSLETAKYLDSIGEIQSAQYIMALYDMTNTWSPNQGLGEENN